MDIDRQFRLARLWSNQELRKLGPLFAGEIVNVSGGENVDKEGGTYDQYFPRRTTWYLTNYLPGSFRGFAGRTNEFLVDLTEPLPAELENRFDVALNHTTLEHIFDVQTAFANVCRMSRDVVIIVVPFCQVQHESDGFGDYWRFTPTCLRELFRKNGFSIIYESESPDENAAIYLLMAGARDKTKWQGIMPEWSPITISGQWIGRRRKSLWKRLAARFGLKNQKTIASESQIAE
jgi:hypothetical protein